MCIFLTKNTCLVTAIGLTNRNPLQENTITEFNSHQFFLFWRHKYFTCFSYITYDYIQHVEKEFWKNAWDIGIHKKLQTWSWILKLYWYVVCHKTVKNIDKKFKKYVRSTKRLENGICHFKCFHNYDENIVKIKNICLLILWIFLFQCIYNSWFFNWRNQFFTKNKWC